MDFFINTDKDKMIERHIRRLVGLESVEARSLLKYYVEARKRLINDLMSVRSDSFTETKLQIILAQLDSGIKQLNRQIHNGLSNSFDLSYEQGIEDGVTEVNRFNNKYSSEELLIPVDTILLSTDKRAPLFNQFESSIASYNESLRNGIQRELTQGLIAKTPYSTLVSNINSKMRDDEWRVHRIVRTELHNIYNISKMDGLENIKENYLPDLQKTMIHPMDARTGQDSIELAQQNPIVDLDKPFVQEYRGKTLKFMAPPNRPNDRAILVPFRRVWG